MHIKSILTKLLKNVTSQKRLSTISYLVEGVFNCKHLNLTNLGRALKIDIQERSMVRRVDRFLCNKHLDDERINIYRALSSRVIKNKKIIELLVDWSSLPNTTEYLLRASLSFDGRSLPIYEEVWEEKYYNSQKSHNTFLANLKKVLPTKCKPIIITDAGFRNPWFKKITSFSWYYVGRVRGRQMIREKGESEFIRIESYHKKRLGTAKNFGEITLCKTSPMATTLYGFKGHPKKRKKYIKRRNRSTLGSACSKAAKEPWLLVSNLPVRVNTAKKIIQLYKMRMQIEEEFRDLKSTKYGFGFEHMRTKGVLRLSNFVLLTSIAHFLACLIGAWSETQKWQHQFQISSTKTKRVISIFSLGCRVIYRKLYVL